MGRASRFHLRRSGRGIRKGIIVMRTTLEAIAIIVAATLVSGCATKQPKPRPDESSIKHPWREFLDLEEARRAQDDTDMIKPRS